MDATSKTTMIEHSAFCTDQWDICETELHLDILAQTESIFALSNGHIGLRGNLDEGEPAGIPGTYLNSMYELRPLPYAESGYGYPESSQTVINITNGKIIRLLVDDEPFDVRYGTVIEHRREMDMREGVLRRSVVWTSPTGRTVRVTSVRMVSFTQRAIVGISYEVEPLDGDVRVVVQSELIANETNTSKGSEDPRVGASLDAPLVSDAHQTHDTGGLLVHHTKASGLSVGAGMTHVIEGPENTFVNTESFPDLVRTSVLAPLKQGQALRLVKFVAYGWSSTRSRSALQAQVEAALLTARETGWKNLLAEQRDYLDQFWNHADIEIDGDPELQQAIRFSLFHTLQASARGERRPIAAKGLTGPGYDGHTFWDSETFVLPVLNFTLPDAAADALRWRHSTLQGAKDRAKQLGLKGAAFPWRTISGEECSGYWPAGTAAFHINADIAYAVQQCINCTLDHKFAEEVGVELLVETARLWASLGCIDRDGKFCINGVTGPDEYSALVDNNVYTNLMAQYNFRSAVKAVADYPEKAQALEVDEPEVAYWTQAAESMYIPYDEKLGVHPQDDTFTNHTIWDFENTPADKYPLFLNYHYYDIYRKQVVKQADLVLAMQLHGHAFTPEQKARNFAYYEALTVRDSSLSAAPQGVVAAQVGLLDLAYDYLSETAFMDLYDLHSNVQNGLHIASLTGTWSVLVVGFGGLQPKNAHLSFMPRLPRHITCLTFNLLYQGNRLHIKIFEDRAIYTYAGEKPLLIEHHGERLELAQDKAISCKIPATKIDIQAEQPAGRKPARRETHVSRAFKPRN